MANDMDIANAFCLQHGQRIFDGSGLEPGFGLRRRGIAVPRPRRRDQPDIRRLQPGKKRRRKERALYQRVGKEDGRAAGRSAMPVIGKLSAVAHDLVQIAERCHPV